jgi:transposase
MRKKRVTHTPEFKAKVALEAIKETSTIAELSRRYRLHANQVYTWKRQLLAEASHLLSKSEDSTDWVDRESELLKKIGELTVERDFLSKGLERYR